MRTTYTANLNPVKRVLCTIKSLVYVSTTNIYLEYIG